MKRDDCVVKIGKYGKKVIVLESKSGEEYEVILNDKGIPENLGGGGAGQVYKVRRASDNKIFAFKEITIKDDAICQQIRKNIETLIKTPLQYHDREIEALVKPIDVVELKNSKHFGYIMEFVDTEKYMVLKKIKKNPNAEILCKTMMNIAVFFDSIHARGMVYQDINKGNILINPETGDIRIIDCDNINPAGEFDLPTVKGTPGFMAPEIYNPNGRPTIHSDYFSMAIFFFWILVRADPFKGKKHDDKFLDHDEDLKQIYSTDILYIFDSNDRSNSINGSHIDKAEIDQTTKLFNRLPKEIKELFERTFSKGIKDVYQRARTDGPDGWISVLKSIQKIGYNECKKCGCKNFYSQSECLECSKKLTPLTPPPSEPISKSKLQPLQNPINIVTFDVFVNGVFCRKETKKSNEEGMFKVRFEKKNGGIIIPYKIHYSSEKKLLGIKNNSDIMWEIEDKPKKLCGKGQTVKLEKDRGIVIKLPPPETKEIQIKIRDVK